MTFHRPNDHVSKLRALADHIETHGFGARVLSAKTDRSRDADLSVHIWDVRDAEKLRILIAWVDTLDEVTATATRDEDTLHVRAVGTTPSGYKLHALVVIKGATADLIRANVEVGHDSTPISVDLLRRLSDARVAESVA